MIKVYLVSIIISTLHLSIGLTFFCNKYDLSAMMNPNDQKCQVLPQPVVQQDLTMLQSNSKNHMKLTMVSLLNVLLKCLERAPLTGS